MIVVVKRGDKYYLRKGWLRYLYYSKNINHWWGESYAFGFYNFAESFASIEAARDAIPDAATEEVVWP